MHRDNIDWTLENGLHCASGKHKCPDWVSIGNPELIDKRATHPVPRTPGGLLNDYVPFYFTPFSIMLLNIKTGRNGIVRRSSDEILIMVSSLPKVAALKLPFLFTDKHAYFQWTEFFDDLKDLNRIDWTLLQQQDFKRDPEDPEKLARYQAEALIHKTMPLHALEGIVCATEATRLKVIEKVEARGLELPVHSRPQWYF